MELIRYWIMDGMTPIRLPPNIPDGDVDDRSPIRTELRLLGPNRPASRTKRNETGYFIRRGRISLEQGKQIAKIVGQIWYSPLSLHKLRSAQ